MSRSFSKKTTTVALVSLALFIATFFLACKKELSESSAGIGVLPDLSVKINSSVAGFITNENNEAVAGATVSAGSTTTNTDKFGYFEIRNAKLVKNAGVVTVSKPGYFKGIKTFVAAENKSAFFRIQLIPKIINGTIDAATGGTVTLTNGSGVSFPANAIINDANKTPYTGIVNVASYWIDPTSSELNKIMPGDLRGVSKEGSMKILATYGMLAVELTGASGELLQIAPDKKAKLTFPIPASIAGTAPASIPLWYFDEAMGLWKEQENAIKTGNAYVGEVSHFSFWNCDVPSSYVLFSCTIIDAKGDPIQNALVKISVAGDSMRCGYGYTNSFGYTSGAIPDRSQLQLQVFSEDNCPLHSQNFTTTNADISFSNIKVIAPNMAFVAGNIINCENKAVANGSIIMIKNRINYHYLADNTGAFNFSTTLCSGSADVSFIPQDADALQSGNSSKVTLITGTNPIGTLRACGSVIEEFIFYSINEDHYSITAPGDSIQQYPSAQTVTFSINGYSITGGINNYADITFTQPGIAVNSTQTLTSFFSNGINDSTTTMPAPISVYITEYGEVGQFFAGNLKGILAGPPPSNTIFNISCSFRIRRRQ